jgi:hypothetical protein
MPDGKLSNCASLYTKLGNATLFIGDVVYVARIMGREGCGGYCVSSDVDDDGEGIL